jgi:hypothetical protein
MFELLFLLHESHRYSFIILKHKNTASQIILRDKA